MRYRYVTVEKNHPVIWLKANCAWKQHFVRAQSADWPWRNIMSWRNMLHGRKWSDHLPFQSKMKKRAFSHIRKWHVADGQTGRRTDGPTDRRMDQLTDWQMDKPTYIATRTHLKICCRTPRIILMYCATLLLQSWKKALFTIWSQLVGFFNPTSDRCT